MQQTATMQKPTIPAGSPKEQPDEPDQKAQGDVAIIESSPSFLSLLILNRDWRHRRYPNPCDKT